MKEDPPRAKPTSWGQTAALVYIMVFLVCLYHLHDSSIYPFRLWIVWGLLIAGAIGFGSAAIRRHILAKQAFGQEGAGAGMRSFGEFLKSPMAKKMAVVWLIALLTCLIPEPGLSHWYPLLHSTLFLIVAPLVAALLAPFLLPQKWNG